MHPLDENGLPWRSVCHRCRLCRSMATVSRNLQSSCHYRKAGNQLVYGLTAHCLHIQESQRTRRRRGGSPIPTWQTNCGGFEGTLLERDALGNEHIVVFRHLTLSGTQSDGCWSTSPKSEALASLTSRANALVIASLLLAGYTPLPARSLHRFVYSVRGRPEVGQAGLRSGCVSADECIEILRSSSAFNGAAENTQQAQQTPSRRLQNELPSCSV